MSKPGPKPQNNAVKIFRGNPGKRPLNEFEPNPGTLNALPAPPDDLLDEDGKQFYLEHGNMLLEMGALGDSHIAGLIVISGVWSEWVYATRELRKDPSKRFNTTANGYEQASALSMSQTSAEKRLKAWFAEYCLTPSSLAGKIAFGKKAEDPLAELKAVMQDKGTG